ncbi:MAG: DUF3800 domain-containing protein [Alistipes sp.]|nr:DUF3800 domain-containing protein [Alistipes sp.]
MAEKYYLFLDECGDQNLANFDPSFPIFTLCGIVLSEEQLQILSSQINDLKKAFWGDKKIILHSRDIRKCQNGFELFFNLETKQSFYERINEILGQDIYTIICCAILKEPYIRQYGKLNDVYGQSLSFIMERTVFYLDGVKKSNIELTTIIEKRGKKEDSSLLAYYNSLIDRGTYWVTADRIKSYFKNFQMKAKQDNIIGLQVADLIAYPITRHILDENAVNLSFDIIKRNIYTKGDKLYGMKVFPKK